MKSKKGYFSLVLHAHLPYVHHPEYDEFLEERWLFEAITETYVPLLRVFNRLDEDGVPFKITMSITPPLMEMLSNESLQRKYVRHMEKLIELADKEVERTKSESPLLHKLAKYYRAEFEDILRTFRDKYQGNILNGFKEFHSKGNIELITCSATHAFLPFYKDYPEMVDLQLELGVKTFERHIGQKPKGIWLAECAYYDDLDEHLAKHDLEFFFLDSHGFWYAEVPPRYGVYRPIITPHNVFAFARDPESSEQIWSADVGYPGDFNYREFYKDVGFEREYDYIKPYIDRSGVRVNTGIKYHKITGKVGLDKKEYYDLDKAMETVKNHAKDFLNKKVEQTKKLLEAFNGEPPIIVAPFDAELYGHWWYEGPHFLEYFFRELAEQDTVLPTTPVEFLEIIDKVQMIRPAPSTWGANGFNEVWLNGKNDWIYPHIHEAIERFLYLSRKIQNPTELEKRALNQALRELLLAQSSDWPFIITTGTSTNYAETRLKTHLNRFLEICDWLECGKIDNEKLNYYEDVDDIFKDML